jgi:predicted DsbA family dithiol-disulfide isomerase
MDERLSLTYYSDLLCVWAHIAQARVDEVARQFVEQITINYRFCSVFGDTAHKIGVGWADRGGYAGFGNHVREAVAGFDHVSVHPELWQTSRPASSTPAHLLIKAVQRVDGQQGEQLLRALRAAFFEQALDIARWPVLRSILDTMDVSADAVRAEIDSGTAFADLQADDRDRATLMVQGSPTFILNDGRQKLYGNVGYGVIEANIKELLRSPAAGAASWC